MQKLSAEIIPLRVIYIIRCRFKRLRSDVEKVPSAGFCQNYNAGRSPLYLNTSLLPAVTHFFLSLTERCRPVLSGAVRLPERDTSVRNNPMVALL